MRQLARNERGKTFLLNKILTIFIFAFILVKYCIAFLLNPPQKLLNLSQIATDISLVAAHINVQLVFSVSKPKSLTIADLDAQKKKGPFCNQI